MELTSIKGIGPKTEKSFSKLGINSIEDLLSYYPYRYNIYSFTGLDESETLIVNAFVESSPKRSFIQKSFFKLSFRAIIEKNIVNIVIFRRGMDYLSRLLTPGKNVTLIGKYDKIKNIFTASDIKFNIKNGDIEPIYHLTSGVTNKDIIKALGVSINKEYVRDYIPDYLVKKYQFISKLDSLRKINFPKNVNDIKQAKVRLKYEELFTFSFKMNYLNKEKKNSVGIKKEFNMEDINKLLKSLPFTLTKDQDKSLSEILKDLQSKKRMNRLLLGDVGSGKTIVSAISIYANFLAGYQSALMAPTEILAIQHYFGIKKVLNDFGVIVEVITGSMTKREKQKIYDRVKNNEIDLLIGTHALLNEELYFNNLGLVITDEQHRFGVNQRSILQKKSSYPDILYLSATPIPRTYALTIYGDLDISMIKSKPNGRKEIITTIKKETEIKDVLNAILNEIKKGHQVYIVSPLVEQNDTLDLSSVNIIKKNIDTAFKGLVRTEIIHGKMRQADKDDIMNDFKNNQIKILISTTVIEVGIDVPNATMMVIYNAERFGLAQLHQLRGRVGRSDLQSYCILISNYDKERLKVMEESNDGFYISEKDFELRGHGDLFGTKQSGDMCFKIADLKKDYDILVQAKNDSEEYINNKGYLNDEFYNNLSEGLDIVD